MNVKIDSGGLRQARWYEYLVRFIFGGTSEGMFDARTAGVFPMIFGTVALVVLTNQNEDKSWTPDNAGNKLCADIARAVVEHYQRKADKPAAPKN